MSRKINWYPGHMEKARRKIREKLKLVDLVIEVRDARIPAASGNPQLADLLEEQEQLVVLNKKDLADEAASERWIEVLSDKYPAALACSAETGENLGSIDKKLDEVHQMLRQKSRQKGREGRELRAMILGIPNSGKSTIINRLSSRGSASTGKKPGVTRGQSWINIAGDKKLMDTPGLLWPDIEDREQGLKLAICGSVRMKVVDSELLACRLLYYLRELNPAGLESRYDLEISPHQHSYDLLAGIGRRRGCLQSGGKVDRNRAAEIVVREFQQGRLGRVTLEKLEEYSDEA